MTDAPAAITPSWQLFEAARSRAGFPQLPAAAPLLNTHELKPLAASRFLDRSQLADLLRDSNRAVGNPLDDATLAAIRADGAFVITGQQPGLLLGPMYTLLKAATAVLLARRLARRAGVPVIPAFWIASEDHDVSEVNHALVNGKRIVTPHDSSLHTAVGRIALADQRDAILQQLGEALAGTLHGEWVVQLARSVTFENFADSFAELLARILPGKLVLVDPLKLRPLTGPVMAHLASRWEALGAALERGSAALRQHGFTPPLERLTIFRIDDAGRRTALSAAQIRSAAADAADAAELSPSAGLRPIVQDAVLPVIATVGGPSELLYLWQIDPLYAAAGVERSRLFPRLSATLIDAGLVGRAQRFGLGGADLLDVQRKLAEYDPHHLAEEDRDLGDVESAAAELIRRLAALDGRIDESSRKVVEKARESIGYQVTKAVQRIREQRLERLGAGRRNLTRIADAVYPGGKLQERAISPLDPLARWGQELIDGLLSQLDVEKDCHWIVEIQQTRTQGETA